MPIHPFITMPPGGIKQNRWLDLDTSNEQHHSMKCISSSQLKFLAGGKSMEHFYQRYISRIVKPSFDDSFRVGTIAHLAVLEPERFEKTVFVCDLDQRTNEYKEYRNTFLEPKEFDLTETPEWEKVKCLEDELSQSDTKEQTKVIKEKLKKAKKELDDLAKQGNKIEIKFTKNGGFLDKDKQEIFLVKSEEMEMYRIFQRQFERHKRLNVMIPECVIEQTGVAQDPQTGLWMSLRGDARCDRGYFIDPKTIGDELSKDSLERYVAQYMLPIQAAHYLEVANLIDGSGKYKKFFFVMMSKKPPFEIALVQLDQDSLEYGFSKRRQILNKIAECEESGKWPTFDCNDYNYGLTISMPRWGYK